VEAADDRVAARLSLDPSVCKVGEVLEVAVRLDAPELDHRLHPFSDPTHTTVVTALANDVLHRPLDRPSAEFEVLGDQAVVAEPVQALLHAAHAVVEPLALACVAGTGLGRLAPADASRGR